MLSEDPLSLRDAMTLLRETRPLVPNILNCVVMHWTANVLLAFGASSITAGA
ncbi:MAG: hydroxyethylthiazole kinase [Beijerinckiaceae bacterium]